MLLVANRGLPTSEKRVRLCCLFFGMLAMPKALSAAQNAWAALESHGVSANLRFVPAVLLALLINVRAFLSNNR